jgi:galactitol-specific phosphotransferase system IIB component
MELNKDKKYKIMACCGFGNGTCELLAQTVREVMKTLEVDAEVKAGPVSFGKAQYRDYDMIFCNRGLLKSFDAAIEYGTPVFGLKNVMSQNEIIEAIENYNKED